MAPPGRSVAPWFGLLLLGYALASLMHFIHNAEFLHAYPGMPATWTRSGVYAAWIGLSAIGAVGYGLWRRGERRSGLALLALYALLGIASLAHYGLAPMAAHSPGMNISILAEVTLAALVLLAVATLALRGAS